MRIGCIQFAPVFGDVDANIAQSLEWIDRTEADLLVLPELCSSGYLFTSQAEVDSLAEEIPGGKTTEALSAAAKRRGCAVVAGLPERAGDTVYNSAVLITPQGYRATYRKVHLFYEEKLWFTPGGDGFAVYDIGPCRVGMMICFDWIFPESMRSLALLGADVVCHPANLVLPYCQDAMITRCLENRVFAVTANRTGSEDRGEKSLTYTGKSQITGHDGAILYRASERDDDSAVVTIDVLDARDKQLNPYNNIFSDRQPDHYGIVTSR